MPFPVQRSQRIILPILTILGTAIFGITLGIYAFNKSTPQTNTGEDTDLSLQGPISQYRPEFTLPDITGAPRHIREWDNRVVIVNFWATWCEPCRREIPVFIQLQASRSYPGLQFIGIAIDDKSAVEDYIDNLETPVNYPMLVGNDDAITISKKYGNAIGVLPYSVIIDRSGHIAYTKFGEFHRDDLEKQIQPLL
ncbi:MAG TPA: TlpA disulfide reductase family protein [Gammaproteobacteria bacterium]